jgi:hypothetical protein
MDTGSLTPDKLAALRSLTKKIQLTSQEVDQRRAAALDVSAWQCLAPFATIGTDILNIATEQITESGAERELRRLNRDGYFHFESLFDRSRVARMYRTIEVLRNAGWPAVFAFVFDDFWSIVRSAPVVTLLERTLGADYRQNSNIWAHWVHASAGASGWPPHVDQKRDPRKFMTLWISLTDATIDNGCIFVVTQAAATNETIAALMGDQPLPASACRTLLQHAVPLPAPAGTLLGWYGDVIHWGGFNHGGAKPRVSLAIEFRAADSEMSKKESPLFDPHAPLPAFRDRLFAIAKATQSYAKMEPLVSRFQPLADQLYVLTRSPT